MFSVLLTLSASLAIYGIGVLFKLLRGYTKDKNIVKKFAVFKLTIILGKIQGAVFENVAEFIAPVG